MMHGQGIIYYSNGDIFEGMFVNGLQAGKGKYKHTNGQITEGDFLNG